MSEIKLHTFAICAYGESPYLEECIQSLQKQNMKSEIILATSTPNNSIMKLGERYNIPVFINDGEKGITQDWNFALSKVKTKYATVAHQDDLYEPDYTRQVVLKMEKENRPLIGFSHYYETRDGEKVYSNTMLNIKKIMLLPLSLRVSWKSRFIRRRVLSFGDPICCPAVCFNLETVKRPVFNNRYRSCEDWEAWEMISRQTGSFVYIKEPLVSHRIHEESATTAIIKDHARVQENYEMYCKFWPAPIARLINHFYTKSEKSNELG